MLVFLILTIICSDRPQYRQFPDDVSHLLRDCNRCHAHKDRLPLFDSKGNLIFKDRKDLERIVKFEHKDFGGLADPETDNARRNVNRALKIILGEDWKK